MDFGSFSLRKTDLGKVLTETARICALCLAVPFAKVLARLFLPFVTTKDGGMGLGLMICQTLVEANGGRIWHVQGLPSGASFRFSLPLVDTQRIPTIAPGPQALTRRPAPEPLAR